jgi:hypothetical protein
MITADRFDVLALSGLDEPVRRYFAHAVAHGAWLSRPAVRLRMHGRIRVGPWLPFAATQVSDGAAFTWRARVPGRRVALLEVVDRLGPDGAVTQGRLLGRIGLFERCDADVLRSAAGRAALEGILSPLGLLPEHGVRWWAAGDDEVAFSRTIAGEETTVHLRLAPDGGVRSAWAMRWGDAGDGTFALLPCGCDVAAERRFGALVVPSQLVVSWGYGTAAQRPFFRSRVTALEPVHGAAR